MPHYNVKDASILRRRAERIMERARGIADEELRWAFIELAGHWNSLAILVEMENRRHRGETVSHAPRRKTWRG
jgi:hypothetical protein